MGGELTGRTVAILGGDERVREIVRLAWAAGAAVRTHGAPPVPLTAEAVRRTAGGNERRVTLRTLRAGGIARGSEA